MCHDLLGQSLRLLMVTSLPTLVTCDHEFGLRNLWLDLISIAGLGFEICDLDWRLEIWDLDFGTWSLFVDLI